MRKKKKTFCYSIIGLSMVLISCGSPSNQQTLPTESLKITYKSEINNSGGVTLDTKVTSEETLYLDLKNGRMREEIIHTAYMGNTEVRSRDVRFFDGEKMYSIAPLSKPNEATYFEIPDGQKPNWAWAATVFDFYKFKGEEEILGRKCKVYEHGEGEVRQKSWIWNDIVLKHTAIYRYQAYTQTTSKEAVKIEENVPMDDSLFKLPPNYTAISLEEKSKRVQESFDERLQKESTSRK